MEKRFLSLTLLHLMSKKKKGREEKRREEKRREEKRREEKRESGKLLNQSIENIHAPVALLYSFPFCLLLFCR
jgi:hypothetical protein